MRVIEVVIDGEDLEELAKVLVRCRPSGALKHFITQVQEVLAERIAQPGFRPFISRIELDIGRSSDGVREVSENPKVQS